MIWHWITQKTWYAIKHNHNKPTNLLPADEFKKCIIDYFLIRSIHLNEEKTKATVIYYTPNLNN